MLEKYWSFYSVSNKKKVGRLLVLRRLRFPRAYLTHADEKVHWSDV